MADEGKKPMKRIQIEIHDQTAADLAELVQQLNANAALGVVSLPVLLDRGYRGVETPEYGVTVIDDAMDFPVLVESFLRRTGRVA